MKRNCVEEMGGHAKIRDANINVRNCAWMELKYENVPGRKVAVDKVQFSKAFHSLADLHRHGHADLSRESTSFNQNNVCESKNFF
jgi:hypothetical protein